MKLADIDFRFLIWAVSGASAKEREFIASTFDYGKNSNLFNFEYDLLSKKR